jgi:crotonobetaine/carnitine-CoA ligase
MSGILPDMTVSDAESIVEILDLQAESLGNRTYITCDDDALSYRELREKSLRFAGGLSRLGLGQGDRIAILSENSLDLIASFFACARLGLIQVPLNIYLRGEFLRYQLENSNASVAVVDELGLQAIRALDPPVSLAHIIVTGGDAGSSPDTLDFDDISAGDPGSELPVVKRADTAMIVYTSGTTGMPKGCIIPHGVFAQVHEAFESVGYVTAGDRMLTPAPMFHMGFLAGMLSSTLSLGASLHCTRRFSASTFMETARRIDATVIYAVGSIGMLLLSQPPSPADRDTASLRVALLPPMTPESQIEFERRFGVPVVAESYGQSECIPVTANAVDGPRQRGSAGRPVTLFSVAVVDDEDHPVPLGEVGEIVVRPRSSHVMFDGYWNDPQATLEAWRNLWHHTGDLGRLDADETLWIIDRKKDSIRRRGENVSSLEVEAAIAKHPSVREVAVHAVSSELGDDDIKACIVASGSFEPEEAFAFFKRELPYFAVPRYVELMDELPVTAVGRVRKQALRDRGITADTWDFETLGLVVARTERRGR